jgi:N-acetylneuraminate synthase/N,N'-diacetyllegionaminate synthase
MPKKLNLETTIFGDEQPAFIIAEAGSNHNCSLDHAKAMIDAAAEAGCDSVKFQIFEADKLVPLGSHVHSVLQPLEFPRQWLAELISHCDGAGVVFSASPFDNEAVDLLVEHGGTSFFKIASPEIHDIPLIRYIARVGCPIVISTGMATLDDIRNALDTVRAESDCLVAVLHCISLYPAPTEHLNLRMMESIARTLDVTVGLSDHSESTQIPAIAVALGAKIIEKHFTLDHSLSGPDHGFALEPEQLKEMVVNVRETESALGKADKEPLYDIEEVSLNNKAIMSRVDIPAGTVITDDMLTVKRAPGGIRPIDVDKVIGRTAQTNVPADTLIILEML